MSLIVYGLGGNFLLTYGLGFFEEILGPEGIQKNLSQISTEFNKSLTSLEFNKSLTSLEFNKSLTSLEFNKSLTSIDVYNVELEIKEA